MLFQLAWLATAGTTHRRTGAAKVTRFQKQTKSWGRKLSTGRLYNSAFLTQHLTFPTESEVGNIYRRFFILRKKIPN
jgi:hypothetical protein